MRIVTIEDFTDVHKFLTLAKEVYEANKAKGFWDKPRSPEHCLMLVISEIAEAVEAARKEDDEQKVDYDSLIAAGPKAIFERKAEFKDTFDDEMADTVIRCLDYIGFARNYLSDDKTLLLGLDWALLELNISLSREDGFCSWSFQSIQNIDTVDFCYKLTRKAGIVNSGNADKVERIELAALSCIEIIACIVWWYGHPSYFTKAITTKLAYNAQRPRLHGKAF